VVREVMYNVRREVPKYNKDGSRAKKDAVQYQCNVCGQWTKSTAIAVDHIAPVIDVENGFIDWNVFVERLFCDVSNLQVICDSCHQLKTNKERFDRDFLKKKALIDTIESWVGTPIHNEICIVRLKEFTKKKLSRYPQDFIDRVNTLKKAFGLKV
jgi:hypothetical protein